jgi:hypothetical protein
MDISSSSHSLLSQTKSADQSTLAVDDFQLKVRGMVKERFVLKDT